MTSERMSVDLERRTIEEASSTGTTAIQGENYVYVRKRAACKTCCSGFFKLFGIHFGVIFLTILFSVLAIIFACTTKLSTVVWYGAPASRYWVWLATLFGGWEIINFIVWCILTILKSIQEHRRVAMSPRDRFLKSIQNSITLVILASILLGVTKPLVLTGLADNGIFYIERSEIIVVMVFALRFIVTGLLETFVINMNRNASEDKVIANTKQQNILIALARGRKKRIQSNVEIETGDDRVFLTIKCFDMLLKLIISTNKLVLSFEIEIPSFNKQNNFKDVAYVSDPKNPSSSKQQEEKQQKKQRMTFAEALKEVLTPEGFLRKLLRGKSIPSSTQERTRTIASKIMQNADQQSKGYFTLSDIILFFDENSEAMFAFALFDRFKCGQATIDDAIVVVSKVLKQHSEMYQTLQDRNNAAQILSRITYFIFWVIMVIIALLIYGLDPYDTLLPISTSFLGFSFVFGDTLKRIWESILLIFVVKPFEIGDRITPVGYPTVIIKRIFLLTTEASTTDGKLYLIPNNILFNSGIAQLKRSSSLALSLDFEVSMETSLESIEALDKHLAKFFIIDKRAPWKLDSYMMWIDSSPNQNCFNLSFWVELVGVTWAMPGKYLNARSIVFKELYKQSKILGFEFATPPQPVILLGDEGKSMPSSELGLHHRHKHESKGGRSHIPTPSSSGGINEEHKQKQPKRKPQQESMESLNDPKLTDEESANEEEAKAKQGQYIVEYPEER